MTQQTVAGIGSSTMGGSPDLDELDRPLAWFEELGVDFVELSIAAYDVVIGGRAVPDRIRKMGDICRRRKLGVTVHAPLSINFMDLDHPDLHRRVCRGVIDACADLEASVMVLHTGIVPAASAAHLERQYAHQRKALEEMGDHAQKRGVTLAVENIFVESGDWHTADPVRLGQELAALAHPSVGGTLDFSHARIMTRFCGMDYAESIRTFAPQVRHLHVHDSFGEPCTARMVTGEDKLVFGLGDLHMPVGWGDMPWSETLPGLPIQAGAVLMLEIRERYWAGLEQSVSQARAFQDLLNGVAAAAE